MAGNNPKSKSPINIASHKPSSPDQWGVMVHMDIIDPNGLLAALSMPLGVHDEDAAVEWAQGALKLWSEGGPYPTEHHEKFAETLDLMLIQVAKTSVGAKLGVVLSPEQVKLMQEATRNSPVTLLTGRVN